ncbi:hypothetical protein SAMN05444380_12422 [Thermophagus xiamenensis]|uniref:Uncharacterized protein n=1 Tax=Thermophagus xiamenensis TaxID=385682 RepID=A0A1I2EST7_9BACT|nr:hypothetical protein SAMN05444380_12422 [Thermophagus xiamenensis]
MFGAGSHLSPWIGLKFVNFYFKTLIVKFFVNKFERFIGNCNLVIFFGKNI